MIKYFVLLSFINYPGTTTSLRCSLQTLPAENEEREQMSLLPVRAAAAVVRRYVLQIGLRLQCAYPSRLSKPADIARRIVC